MFKACRTLANAPYRTLLPMRPAYLTHSSLAGLPVSWLPTCLCADRALLLYVHMRQLDTTPSPNNDAGRQEDSVRPSHHVPNMYVPPCL